MRLNIVIPVFNEEHQLHGNMVRLHQFLKTMQNGMTWELVIANNGSTDRTLEVATNFSRTHEHVRVIHIVEKGRGRALKEVWMKSDADILSYMDADLSSDLGAFPELIEAVANGRFDVATGSRLLKPELTTRSMKREIASRCYNRLARTMLRTQFSDAQCGFKAITREAAQHLLPLVKDTGWFFDTELLFLAVRSGYRIWDMPVRWLEGSKSSVRLFPTVIEDLKGLWRLRKKPSTL